MQFSNEEEGYDWGLCEK